MCRVPQTSGSLCSRRLKLVFGFRGLISRVLYWASASFGVRYTDFSEVFPLSRFLDSRVQASVLGDLRLGSKCPSLAALRLF